MNWTILWCRSSGPVVCLFIQSPVEHVFGWTLIDHVTLETYSNFVTASAPLCRAVSQAGRQAGSCYRAMHDHRGHLASTARGTTVSTTSCARRVRNGIIINWYPQSCMPSGNQSHRLHSSCHDRRPSSYWNTALNVTELCVVRY